MTSAENVFFFVFFYSTIKCGRHLLQPFFFLSVNKWRAGAGFPSVQCKPDVPVSLNHRSASCFQVGPEGGSTGSGQFLASRTKTLRIFQLPD